MHLFISDLHLSAERPEANERFFGFMEGKARGAAALYVLGDLFEAWIGDDDDADPFNRTIIDAFARLTRGGTALYLMHGNRDFLMGKRFCVATGAKLLEDPTVLDIDGTRTLLMHGDTLCTDDADYQKLRRRTRNRVFRTLFQAAPLEWRRRFSVRAREKSKSLIAGKPAGIMDVNDAAVRAAFHEHGITRMVHGHTHRAGHHELEVDGRRCERWVLPDWYGRGGYLEISRGRTDLVRF